MSEQQNQHLRIPNSKGHKQFAGPLGGEQAGTGRYTGVGFKRTHVGTELGFKLTPEGAQMDCACNPDAFYIEPKYIPNRWRGCSSIFLVLTLSLLVGYGKVVPQIGVAWQASFDARFTVFHSKTTIVRWWTRHLTDVTNSLQVKLSRLQNNAQFNSAFP